MYRDSIPPPDVELANVMFKKVRRLIMATSMLANAGYPEGEWFTEIPQGPYQTNSYDCGIFVCMAMRAAILGIPFTLPNDVPAIRRSIRNSFRDWPEQNQGQSLSNASVSQPWDLWGMKLFALPNRGVPVKKELLVKGKVDKHGNPIKTSMHSHFGEYPFWICC